MSVNTLLHQELTGRAAIHPFAFVQSTDPALDATNEVAANKAWIDTSIGNALKIRNAANTSWITLLAGGAVDSFTAWALVEVLIELTVEELPGETLGVRPTWALVNYI